MSDCEEIRRNLMLRKTRAISKDEPSYTDDPVELPSDDGDDENYSSSDTSEEESIDESNSIHEEEESLQPIVHVCFYCYAPMTRPARHFESEHKDEMDVAKILSMKKSSLDRKKNIRILVRKGNYHNNLKYLATREGIFIAAKKSIKDDEEIKKFVPCPQCLAFVKKGYLWQHGLICPLPTPHKNKKDVSNMSRAMLSVARNPKENESYLSIIARLRMDDIYNLILNDDLIMRAGFKKFESKGVSQEVYIRQVLRRYGRLLQAIHQITHEKYPLAHYMNVESFDVVVRATKQLCGEIEVNQCTELRKPALGLQIGHALKNCAILARGIAIREGDDAKLRNVNNFLTLLADEWSSSISSAALHDLKERKRNASDLLPLTRDLLNTNEFIRESVERLDGQLRQGPSAETWQQLSKFVLARLVLFNKRRSKEASRLTIADYEQRKTWEQSSNLEEIMKSFTDIEKQIAKKQQLLTIKGKTGSTVPVIMCEDIVDPMQLLYLTRKELQIQVGNIYFFCNVFGAGDTHIRGHDALTFALPKDGSIARPDLIKSTNLRKYCATVCQLINLTGAEQNWLQKHLGHSDTVHNDFYKVHHDATEFTKVTTLLLAVEKGVVGNTTNKTLNELAFDGEKPYACDCCDYRASWLSHLNTHKLTHTSEKPYACDRCDYRACQLSRLKLHKLTHTGEKPYSCDRCDYRASQLSHLKIHKRTHTGEKPYACDHCDYRACRLSRLKTHKLTHTGEKPYACDLCDYRATDRSNLERHKLTHTGEKPFACDCCDYVAGWHGDLKAHKLTHTGEKPYACNCCDYRSSQLSDLRAHKFTHTGDKPYACDRCDYQATLLGDLRRHVLTHTGEKPYACDCCDYRATLLGDLRRHVLTHTGEKPYACDRCDYRANRRGNLRKHKLTHTGVKPYACHHCEYRAAERGTLRKHLFTHTGEKPYACDLCDYRSSLLHALRVHKLKHTGEKPFACDRCDYRASQFGLLSKHKLRHTGEKPFACEHCGYRAIQLEHMRKHMLTHTDASCPVNTSTQ